MFFFGKKNAFSLAIVFKDFKTYSLSFKSICVERASPCWSPFEKQHIESIQRAAARFFCCGYSSYSSVTSMAQSLAGIEKPRKVDSVIMTNKVVNNLNIYIPYSYFEKGCRKKCTRQS